jgi:hypothetical protein
MRSMLVVFLVLFGLSAFADEREALSRYRSVLLGMSAEEKILMVRLVEASLMVARDEVASDIRHNANAEASWWRIVDLIHKAESKDPIIFARDVSNSLSSDAPDAFKDMDIFRSAIFFSLHDNSVKNPEITFP